MNTPISMSYPTDARQSGIVLPVVLIFLVLMTLLGITSMRNITMEERMAGNSRYQQLAFQAAETALRSCEGEVLSKNTGKFFDTQTAQAMVTGVKYWDLGNAKWADNNYFTTVSLPSATYGGLMTARCMVEKLAPTVPKQGGLPYCPFRVTARVDDSTGGGTVVLLQSYIIAPLNSGRSCPVAL